METEQPAFSPHPPWAAHPDTAGGQCLADTLAELSGALDEHLDAEEAHILPLAAAHLTVSEWQELERDGMASLPMSQGPLMIHGTATP